MDDIRSALEWAGLEYDYGEILFTCMNLRYDTPQGPAKNGPHGPYYQVCHVTIHVRNMMTDPELVEAFGSLSRVFPQTPRGRLNVQGCRMS